LGAFLGDGFFPGFAVLTDADAVKATIHAPRNGSVTVFELADDELWLTHAEVAEQTGQPRWAE
jgi:hypothetical protein